MNIRKVFFHIYSILFYSALGIILLFGIFHFIRYYLLNCTNGFFCDECKLVINCLLPWQELFLKLPNEQCTPPLFSLFTKFLVGQYGINEAALRVFPFTVMILAILLFPFLEFKILKNRFGILFALLLLVLNYNVLEYTYNYKQYVSDFLMSIVLVLCGIHLKDRQLNSKQAILAGLAGCLCLFLSYTAAIIIAGLIIAKILYDKYKFRKFNLKSYFVFFIPFFFYFVYLIIFVLIPVKKDGFMDWFWFSNELAQSVLTKNEYHSNIWQSTADFVLVGYYNLKVNLIVLSLILLGSLFLIYRQNRFFFYFCISEIFFILSLSYFNLYPFGPHRTIMYIFPIFYILIAKLFDLTYLTNKKYLYVTFILYAFLTDYQEFYNAVISKITNPYAFEASAAKYYYRILEHSDIKPDDYIYWYQPQEMMLYNYKNTLHLNNIQEQNLPWPFLKKIPQGKNIFIYLTKEYYSDYEEEYKFADNFVKNECSVIYTIDDDMGSGKGQVIKCNKITPAETEE